MGKTAPTLEKIAQNGDDLETLKALRQKLARTIDESKSGRDISSLSRQLQLVMDRIGEIERRNETTPGETVLDIVRKRKFESVPEEYPWNEEGLEE